MILHRFDDGCRDEGEGLVGGGFPGGRLSFWKDFLVTAVSMSMLKLVARAERWVKASVLFFGGRERDLGRGLSYADEVDEEEWENEEEYGCRQQEVRETYVVGSPI